MQIKDSENTLEKISGNSIQSNKKRKITFAATATGSSSLNDTNLYTYRKPTNYEEFLTELISACKDGDSESKKLMEELVPHLVHVLKHQKQWEVPDHCLFNSRETLDLTSNEKDFHKVSFQDDIFDVLISSQLDKVGSEEPDTVEDNANNASIIQHDSEENATEEAICNLISDINPVLLTEQPHSTVNPSSFLRDLQPHKEKPSKDRSRRFHCPALYGDQTIPIHHNILLFDFWAIHPCKKVLRELKYLLAK